MEYILTLICLLTFAFIVKEVLLDFKSKISLYTQLFINTSQDYTKYQQSSIASHKTHEIHTTFFHLFLTYVT